MKQGLDRACKAIIDGEVRDARSQAEYIAPNEKVHVVDFDGFTVIVRPGIPDPDA